MITYSNRVPTGALFKALDFFLFNNLSRIGILDIKIYLNKSYLK